MASFRLSARNVFLTFPRTSIKFDDYNRYLAENTQLQGYKLCSERHDDGGLHLHALLCYKDKLHTRNARYWDWNGEHPNVQSVKNKEDVIRYIEKEPVELAGNLNVKRTWGEILCEAETFEGFMEAVKSGYPRDFVLHYNKIETFGEIYFNKKVCDYIPEYTVFVIPPDLESFMLTFNQGERPRSLFLEGPSRSGKTEWARSLGPHCYMAGAFNLNLWNNNAEYIVLDDIQFEYIPAKKMLFGAQKEFTLTDKYKGKRLVKWGKACIYLFNKDMNPFKNMSCYEKDWYDLNVFYCELFNKLY